MFGELWYEKRDVSLERGLMETSDIVTFGEVPFHLSTEELGDTNVIEEVVLFDCYRLKNVHIRSDL